MLRPIASLFPPSPGIPSACVSAVIHVGPVGCATSSWPAQDGQADEADHDGPAHAVGGEPTVPPDTTGDTVGVVFAFFVCVVCVFCVGARVCVPVTSHCVRRRPTASSQFVKLKFISAMSSPAPAAATVTVTHSPAVPTEEKEEEKELDPFPSWDLNSVVFVWGHFGHSKESLWIIYGNYSMRMPKVIFAESPKKQFVLNGAPPTFDIFIHPVRELLAQFDADAFMVVHLAGEDFLLPGGWMQRVLRIQSQAQSKNVKNPYNISIRDSSQRGTFNLGLNQLFNRSNLLSMSSFMNDNKVTVTVKVLVVGVGIVGVMSLAVKCTAQIENLFKNLVEISASLPDLGVGKAIASFAGRLFGGSSRSTTLNSIPAGPVTTVSVSAAEPLQIAASSMSQHVL